MDRLTAAGSLRRGRFSVGLGGLACVVVLAVPNGALLLGGSLSPVSLVGLDLEQAIATILEIRGHG